MKTDANPLSGLRDYYELGEAANILNSTQADLIHMGAKGEIRIYAMVESLTLFLHPPNFSIRQSQDKPKPANRKDSRVFLLVAAH